ncbi:hypothetical protein [Microcella sp.]|uniref:hypothetical protein n=1 Tax=Microcella sp. TaxID=1913979 RepID=UPI00299F5FD2|nr:hypothetical protein [Microcella sp.]MDX2026227.1 hypothetical protein [Microcella sp.]
MSLALALIVFGAFAILFMVPIVFIVAGGSRTLRIPRLTRAGRNLFAAFFGLIGVVNIIAGVTLAVA